MNFTKTRQQIIKTSNAKRLVTLAMVCAFLSVFSVNAQSTPEPPTPPKTASLENASYSVSKAKRTNKKSSSSVSISTSNEHYKFRARFNSSKNKGAKALLIKNLGEKNLTIKGNTYTWLDTKNGDEIFKCKLTNNRLYIYADLNSVSQNFSNTIKSLGKDLKYYISETDS